MWPLFILGIFIIAGGIYGVIRLSDIGQDVVGVIIFAVCLLVGFGCIGGVAAFEGTTIESEIIEQEYNYCPNCGAEMTKENDK